MHHFNNNSSPEYRSVVDSIWGLLHDLVPTKHFADPRLGQQVLPKGIDLEKLLAGLVMPEPDSTEPESATSREDSWPQEIEDDEGFIGIVQSQYFQHWLEARASNSDTLRVDCSDPDPRTLCSSLPAYIKRQYVYHDIFHLDMEKVSETRDKILGSSNIIGLVILTIARFVLRAFAARASHMTTEKAGLRQLIRLILAQSTSGVIGDTEGLEQHLAHAVEDLGSNLVKVATTDFLCRLPWSSPPMQLAILVSGLDCIRNPPELGRIVHCIRDFQIRLLDRRRLTFKVLFAQRPCRDLKGFLSGIACISEEERQGEHLPPFLAVGDCFVTYYLTLPFAKQIFWLECLDSLKIPGLPPRKDIRDKHEGTLGWFWEDAECKAWMAEKSSAVLCLLGKPACGKSVLAKSIVETLESIPRKPGDTQTDLGAKETVVSFFFQGEQPELRSRRTMLHQILHGLLKQKPSLFPCFQAEFHRLRTSDPHSRPVWQDEDLESVWAKIGRYTPYGQQEKVYIVIDGLDEAHEEAVACAKSLARAIFHKEKSANDGHGVCFKLFVATQEGSAVAQLRYPVKGHSIPFYQLRHQERNDADILEYTKSFLDGDVIERLGWKESDIKASRDILVKQSCGIFLWAELARGLIEEEYFGHQRDSASPQDFEKFLRSIPKDIGDLYERLLGRLTRWASEDQDDRDRKRNVERMLQIAVHAKYLLSVREFRDFYVVRRENPSPRQDLCPDLKYLANIIPTQTKNLLDVYVEHGAAHADGHAERIVRMLHPTATDYLLNRNKALLADPSSELCIVEHASELPILGLGCIQFLALASHDLEIPGSGNPSWPEGLQEFNKFAQAIDSYPLLAYALKHLTDHLDLQQGDHCDEISNLLARMHACKGPIRWLLSDWMAALQTRLEAHGADTQPKSWLFPWWDRISACIRYLLGAKEQTRAFKNRVLHCAAALGLRTAVKIALAAGAEVDSQSDLHQNQERAISLAIISSPPHQTRSVVKVLLEGGADLKLKTYFGGTPLHYAGKFGRDDTVDLLLQHDLDVNARDDQDRTPLHRTVIGFLRALGQPREVSAGSVKLLLEAGADLWATDKQGLTPIHWTAGSSDRDDILDILIQFHAGEDAGASTKLANQKCRCQQSTPLHWASSHGQRKNVQYLLRQGARVDALDARDKSAVNWAARYGHRLVLQDLLKQPESERVINTPELAGYTPLMWACRWGHSECVTLLLRAGANVNSTNPSVAGQTPLIYACRWGQTECVRLLIQAGANVNLADEERGSPVSWAVTYGHLETIRLLLKHEAVLDTPEGGRPLLCWAAGSGNIETFQELQRLAEAQKVRLDPDESDYAGNTPFMHAAKRNHLAMAKHLYELRAQGDTVIRVDHANQEGSTALLLAAEGAGLDVVEWLVETVGLDVDHRNDNHDTALHCAAARGNKEVMDYLRSRRVQAQANVRNMDGKLYTNLWNEYQRRNE